MHELALVEEMLEVACGAATSHGIRQVRRVHVTVGTLAAYPDAIRFAWDACRGHFPPLGSAHLDIEEVPPRWLCPACESQHTAPAARCPICGALLRLVAGTELRLDYLEGDGEGEAVP